MKSHLPGRWLRLIFAMLFATGCLVLGGCRHAPLEAVPISGYPGSFAGSSGERCEWYASTTKERDVLCIFYSMPSRKGSYRWSTVSKDGDYWVTLNGARLNLKRGECLLILNGRNKGDPPVQDTVPWMKIEDLKGKSSGDEKKQAEEFTKLFAPLIDPS